MSSFASLHARGSGFVSPLPLRQLGGLNEDENPQALRPDELRIANDCVRKGSMTGTRPGVRYGDSDYTAARSGTPNIQGIHEYARNNDATRDLITVANGEVYKGSASAALDKSATTITSGQDNLWTFADFQGKMFAAGGADSDGFWYWDGTGAGSGVLGHVSLSFDVKFVFSKWNFLFVGGMDGTPFDDNPLIVRYCDYASDATLAASYPSSNVIPGQLLGENFGIGSHGSEYTTGMSSYQTNEADLMLFLTNRRIVSFAPNPSFDSNANIFRVHDTVATGCVNHNAFVNLGIDVGDSVYIGPDGIHSLAQSQEYGSTVTEYLSWPIRKTFDGLNRSRLKYASGSYWPAEGIVLFLVSTGSNTKHDLILCMDIKNVGRLTPSSVRWYKWNLTGITANIIRPARDADGTPYPYVGGTAGQLCRFERTTYSDLVTGAINTEFRTRDEDFGIASREKKVGDAFISIQGIGAHTVQHTHIFDDGEVSGQSSHLPVPAEDTSWGDDWGTMQWGGADKTARHRIPGIGSSVTISHRFSHSGANEPFWIGLIDQKIGISGPTDDADANTVGS